MSTFALADILWSGRKGRPGSFVKKREDDCMPGNLFCCYLACIWMPGMAVLGGRIHETYGYCIVVVVLLVCLTERWYI